MIYNSEKAIETFRKIYPKGVELYYVDYNDQLRDDQCQEIIRKGYSEKLDECIMDWDNWYEYEEIFKQISEETEFDTQDLIDDDNLREVIQNSDTSDVLRGLIRNTSKTAMFYDLEHEVESSNSSEDVARESKKIAKRLKIDYKEHKTFLHSLVSEAYYGGALCMYWYGDIDDLLPIENPDFKYIDFSDCHLCIMDRGNGSGDIEKCPFSISAELKRANLWLDKEAPGYSFGYEVCGLYMPAFEGSVRLNNQIGGAKIIKMSKDESDMEKYEKKETEWDARLKKNKSDCSPFDPRYKSHDWEYHNEPMNCRDECKNCHRIIMD